jgi:tetratricopeptide (TPR) repeat protein
VIVKSRNPQLFIATAVLVLVVSVVYSNSFNNGFHFDDYHTVVNNPAIRSLKNIPEFFTNAKTFSILPANQTYRPIVSTTLAFDYWLGHGLNPVYFHLGTFVIYLLQLVAMLLMFRIAMDFIRPDRNHLLLATLAASWYGLHPAMAETVNYIIQRGDVYSTCGVVCALLLYAARPDWRRYGIYLLPYVLALLSKPPAIVLPAILFAWVVMIEAPADGRYRKAVWAAMPSLVVGAALMAFEAAMTPKSFTPSTLSSFAWYITQPYVLLRNFVTFFLPLHLNVDTDLRAFPHLNAEAVAGFAFLAALISAIVLLAMNKQLRLISFGLLWFLIGSLPTALYKLSEVNNDHRLFLPYIGMALACVWTGYLLVELLARRGLSPWIWKGATALALILLSSYGWAAHVRNRVWHSNLSLWYDDVLKCPHNGRGLMNYGLAQMDAGHFQIALHYFEQAEKYTPNYPTLEINLGIVNGILADQGHPALAAIAQQHFLRAIALDPADDQTHAYYGRWLLFQGDMQRAIQQLSLAVRLNPRALMQRNLLIEAETEAGDSVAARQIEEATLKIAPSDQAAKAALLPTPLSAAYWINQSMKEYQRGQYLLAIALARRALQIDPHSAAAFNNIGASYGAMRQWDKAVQYERLALQYDPALTIARNNLALFLQKKVPGSALSPQAVSVARLLNLSLRQYQAGNYQECICSAQTALKIDPSSAAAWNNIAAGYSAMGQWPQAIAAAQRALAIEPGFALAKNNLAWAKSHVSRGTH